MRKTTATQERLRLSVYRSNRNMYAQIINDFKGITVTGVSSLTADIKNKKFSGPKERAREIGKLIAKKALEKKIKKVVFDRGKFRYHGAVKELAEGAREVGLEF